MNNSSVKRIYEWACARLIHDSKSEEQKFIAKHSPKSGTIAECALDHHLRLLGYDTHPNSKLHSTNVSNWIEDESKIMFKCVSMRQYVSGTVVDKLDSIPRHMYRTCNSPLVIVLTGSLVQRKNGTQHHSVKEILDCFKKEPTFSSMYIYQMYWNIWRKNHIYFVTLPQLTERFIQRVFRRYATTLIDEHFTEDIVYVDEKANYNQQRQEVIDIGKEHVNELKDIYNKYYDCEKEPVREDFNSMSEYILSALKWYEYRVPKEHCDRCQRYMYMVPCDDCGEKIICKDCHYSHSKCVSCVEYQIEQEREEYECTKCEQPHTEHQDDLIVLDGEYACREHGFSCSICEEDQPIDQLVDDEDFEDVVCVTCAEEKYPDKIYTHDEKTNRMVYSPYNPQYGNCIIV